MLKKKRNLFSKNKFTVSRFPPFSLQNLHSPLQFLSLRINRNLVEFPKEKEKNTLNTIYDQKHILK